MQRQNILLMPTDTELLEEADCTHALPGSGEGAVVGGVGQPLVDRQARPTGSSSRAGTGLSGGVPHYLPTCYFGPPKVLM